MAALPRPILTLGVNLSLNTVTVTWTEEDFTQATVNGSITFVPSNTLTDATDGLGIGLEARTYRFVNGTGSSAPLVATDNVNLLPSGWTYVVTVALDGLPPYSFNCFIPFSGGASQKLSSLTPTQTVAQMASYLPLSGGIMSGPVTLAADPSSALQAATKQYVDNHLLATVPTLVATTGIVGFNLAATSGDIITWTAPNDGNMHRVMTIVEMHVTSALTGGQVQAVHNPPDGGSYNAQIIAANSAAGYHNISNPVYLVAPGGTFAVHQGSGVSAGAGVVWAEIWAL